ncbi:MAG TPA: DUF5666 domain-containing protein [Anaerolineales bacterium]|nr:DUF5666 domain-containing protein [Anaerolineales bacterium]
MSEMDDLLQNRLEALENGKPLKAVVDELPGEASGLTDLIYLASAVRGLPHPHPSLQGKLIQRRRQPGRSRPASPLWRFNWAQPRPALLLSGGLLAAMVVVVLFASLVGVGVWLAGPRSAQAATLMSISGPVEVASSATAADWRLASDGFRVVEGQRIRTGAGGSATLVFYEGTRALLGSYTDVTLRQLQGGWDRSLRVVLDQRMGETVHSVVPLRGDGSLYYVNTPSGTASVHGTTFRVDVDPAGHSRFIVNKGKVRVNSQGSEVWLLAGQITAVEPGLAALDADYQYELKGVINDTDPWEVNGVYFDLADGVVIEGDLEGGDFVEVEGHVFAGGVFEAYHIEEKTSAGELKSSFTGVLETMSPDPWVVSGRTLSVVAGVTELDDELAVYDPVDVTFEVLPDGTWLALKIETLADEPAAEPEPIPGPALTLAKSASPTEYSAVGELISYSFVISNTGDTVLSGPFAVIDDKAADEACPAEPVSLAPGEDLTCTASYTTTAADILAGSVTNSAYATADNSGSPVTSNTDSATVLFVAGETALDLEKSASPSEYDAIGDVISYSYTVTNTGTTDIAGPFTVSDDKVAAVDCTSAPASLTPGASFTCARSYTISAADLVAGSVTNVAVAAGAAVTSNTDSATVTSLVEPAQLTLDKSASPSEYAALGDVINYTYTIMNSGGVEIAGPFPVTDDKIATLDCSSAPASLLPGESFTCTASYTITAADLVAGSITNVAQASGQVDGVTVTSNSDSETVTSSPVTDCTGNETHPKGQMLADEHGVTYEEIMGWFCQRFGFGEIDLAYSLAEAYAAQGITAAQLFDMRHSGLGWGQIKNWLKSLPEATTEEPAETESASEPPGRSNNPNNEPPGRSNKPNEPPGRSNNSNNNPPGRSNGSNRNQSGQNLSARYGVPYDVIMGWYNRGHSFADIDQAYSLSQTYAAPVAEIFAMRAAGQNWGQIRQELRDKGSRKP